MKDKHTAPAVAVILKRLLICPVVAMYICSDASSVAVMVTVLSLA